MRLMNPSTTSDFSAPGRPVRLRRRGTKQRMLRGMWGAAGFVTGGALTAMVLHGGASPPGRDHVTAMAPPRAEPEPLAALPPAVDLGAPLPMPTAPPLPATKRAALPAASARPAASVVSP
jgi:hypothetical protein